MKRIILFIGGVETLGFFSLQMEKTFRRLGHETFIFDYDREAQSAFDLLNFIKKGSCVMLTFNFHGICNEELLRDSNNTYIWEELRVPCYNIVVDHPFYYDRFMEQLPPDYTQISIDQNHEAYLERFYPHIKRGPFLPLAGTDFDWEGEMLPIKDRPIDVVFTGSWAEPEFWGQYMSSEGPEYEEFYRRVLKEQLDNPDLTFEEVFEPAIRREAEEGDDISDDMLRQAYAHMIYFDMYVRYYFRGEVVRHIAQAGIRVVCVGGGWDHMSFPGCENIECVPYVDSAECLRFIRKAKISINVMPWFKRGSHDRIFNSMLNGAACLTDSSLYLEKILEDGKNCRIFDLKRLYELPGIIREMLSDEGTLQRMADEGRLLALAGHTWEKRAMSLSSYFENA